MIDNVIIGKFVYVIIKPKLVFYQNYNLFIYFKSVIVIFGKVFEKKNFSDFDSFNNKNDFSEIENKSFKKDFR